MQQYQHRDIQSLSLSILSKDAQATVQALEKLLNTVKSDSEAVKEITEPAVISSLHQQLIAAFDVPPRSMLLKARVPARVRRAILFVQAMQNGMRRVV